MRLAEYRQKIRLVAGRAHKVAPLAGPLFALMEFFRPLPLSASKRRPPCYVTTKPDRKNCLFALEDALNPDKKNFWRGLWTDDALVDGMELRRYTSRIDPEDRVGMEPGIRVRIWKLREGEGVK
jgi:Holliday junction resolvase RusA-like endonuclease